MTVRYKSATVDEFIEHHASDVSRGGIYIKTPNPFPAGTLLKFEIRIADEQAVLSGVGRVVWKREPDQVPEGEPSGMGVKFIKIDEKSKSVISKLVDKSGGRPSTFDRGADGNGEAPAEEPIAASAAASEAAPAVKAVAAVRPDKRASTMLGLGAIGAKKGEAKSDPAPSAKDDDEEKPATSGGFFPASESEPEMRPPEERTVMKQAAELLQQALSEAGGSLDEIGAIEPAKPEKAAAKSDPPPPDSVPPVAGDEKPAAKKADKPVEAKPAEKPVDKPIEKKPSSIRPAPISAKIEPEEKGGNGKLIIIGVAIAAAVGIGIFAMQGGDNAATDGTAKPSAAVSTKPSAKPSATETAKKSADPVPTATETSTAATSAAPTAATSAAPTAEPKPTATTAPTAKPTATTAPTPKPTATTAPTPKPTATAVPTPKPTATTPPKPDGDPYD